MVSLELKVNLFQVWRAQITLLQVIWELINKVVKKIRLGMNVPWAIWWDIEMSNGNKQVKDICSDWQGFFTSLTCFLSRAYDSLSFTEGMLWRKRMLYIQCSHGLWTSMGLVSLRLPSTEQAKNIYVKWIAEIS